ncbi:N-acyl homoserine lactonase family protein [Ketobacter sp. MCCC 1A13808]|uniref:N-acyl homoserine lactonase family protein n=1 Tax=Ketobacter sp. MCCC 1A13808 TaxID=2602738 RepID=UPI000F1CD9D7|nr:N-acyl homoserine lactonase family protein [Ketobacter sp. MCCC 1A13808]MVF11721.1 N-acyl homoserine lactonase family protein [Ketobacter sp. MCCC 1A13808]RLP55331.1 MAG: N-acyl homoserine lactonase family protein [Ketobacter sp.]
MNKKLWLNTILAANMLGLSACATLTEQAEEVETVQPLTLFVFECGNIVTNDVSIFSPGIGVGEEKKLTDSCYLIRHAKGDLIWDTGLPDQIGEKGIDVFDGKFHMSVSHPFSEQLAEIGVDPATIKHLAISHFHSDHTGNANLFKNAELLIQKEEFDAAFGADPKSFGFNPDSYSELNRDNIKVLQDDYDVFGDGTVVIKRAPGHTPGHQMLYLNLDQTGPVLLSGDLYHFTSNREHQRVPSFNFSKEQTLESMQIMEAFATEHQAQVWIQHDKEQNETMRHSPEFYQ